jgi:hypothetical protein
LCVRFRTPSARLWRKACARPMLSSSAVVRSCSPVQGASAPPGSPAPWAATARPCATPSAPSTKGASKRRSARAPPARAPSPRRFRCPARAGAPAGAAAPEPPRLRQAHQPVDPGVGRRGRLRGGAYRETGDGRDRSGHAGKAGGALAAGQAMDHEPRPRVREKKRRRDRLMRLAEENPGWVVGFEDETWWSRLRPRPRCTPGARKASLCAWSNARSPRTTPIREGRLLLRALRGGVRAETWLRFVDGAAP